VESPYEISNSIENLFSAMKNIGYLPIKGKFRGNAFPMESKIWVSDWAGLIKLLKVNFAHKISNQYH